MSILYSNYVQEYMEKNIADTGNQCVCLAEFFDNEYQDVLQAEEEGLYDPDKDVWEFWEGFGEKTFEVTVSTSYTVEAEDENDAIQQVEELLDDDLANNHLTEIFGFNAEKQ